MTRVKFILLAGFVIALVAGFVVGRATLTPTTPVMTSPPHPPIAPDRTPGMMRNGWLARELDLTADQQKKLEEIWSAFATTEPATGATSPGIGPGSRNRDERRQLDAERDKAIHDLLKTASPDLTQAYDKIITDYHARIDDLAKKRRDQFEAARQKMLDILTPEQRVKYEKLMQHHEPSRHRQGGRAPASQPATQLGE